MRRLLGGWIVLLALLATPALANVLGIERYMGFAPIAYSGDITIETARDVITGHIYRGETQQRSEVLVNRTPLVTIADLGTGRGVVQSDVMRVYSDVDLMDYGVRDWVPQLQFHKNVEIVPVGGTEAPLEEVNGETARRYSIKGNSPEGTAYQGELWATEDGIILRLNVQIATQPGPVVYNLTHLQRGAQDASLFKHAVGYAPVPWAQVQAMLLQ